jgi:hypothetical protein
VESVEMLRFLKAFGFVAFCGFFGASVAEVVRSNAGMMGFTGGIAGALAYLLLPTTPKPH